MTVAITVIQFQSLAFLASSSSPVPSSAVSSMITLDIKFPSFSPVWCNSPGQRVHSLTHWYGPAHPPTLGAASHQFNNQLRNNILHSMRQSVKQLFLHLWHFVALIRPIVPFQQFRFNPASHSPGPAPLWRSVSFHSSNTAHHSPRFRLDSEIAGSKWPRVCTWGQSEWVDIVNDDFTPTSEVWNSCGATHNHPKFRPQISYVSRYSTLLRGQDKSVCFPASVVVSSSVSDGRLSTPFLIFME
jgi:hypothetical protein